MNIGIVTGCAGGIGRAISLRLRGGARIVGIDRRACGDACDVHVDADLALFTSDAAYRQAVLAGIRGYLGGSLSVLVNNAAVQILASTAELTADDWRETIDVNVLAPALLAAGLLTELEAAKGCIVNVGSIHGSLTKPRFVAYATSKAALMGLTRAMAVDLGGRVRVNAVAPAAVDTPMLREGFAGDDASFAALGALHPAGRIGAPEEIAAAVAYLASPDAGFITGAVLPLDGGIGARLHDPL